MQSVGIGVIGLGFGSAVHIPGFKLVTGAKVIGVASKRLEHARRVSDIYSLPRWFSTWQELLECPEIHAVSVATPPYLTEEIVLAAIKNGKAVFCEKPFGANVEQAQRMHSEAASSHLPNMIDFWFRVLPAFQYLKNKIETGEFGTIQNVNIEWLVSTWSDPSRQWTWRSSRSQGGGIMSTRAVHSLDYIEWLFGPIQSIRADLDIKIPYRPLDDGVMCVVDTEDSCNISIAMRSGASVKLSVSAVEERGSGHRMEVIGEKHSITMSNEDPKDFSMDFKVWLDKERISKFDMPRELAYEAGIDNRLIPFCTLAQRFVSAVEREDVLAEPSFHAGLRTRLLMDLVVASGKEDRWLDVPAKY